MYLLPEPCERHVTEWRRLKRHRRRAVKYGNAATLTLGEWLQILERHGWRCVFCGGAHGCMEHVVPLSLGGGTTAANCVPCCLDCNALRNEVVEGVKGVLAKALLTRHVGLLVAAADVVVPVGEGAWHAKPVQSRQARTIAPSGRIDNPSYGETIRPTGKRRS